MARLKRQVQRQIERRRINQTIASMAIAYVLQVAVDRCQPVQRHIMRDRLVYNDAEQFVAAYMSSFPGEYKTPKQFAPILAAYAEEWGFKGENEARKEIGDLWIQ